MAHAPSVQTLTTPAMSRRPPLSNLPNAVNSPFHLTTTTTNKRSRSQSTTQRDSHGQPPSKRQATENPGIRTPVHHATDSKGVPPRRGAIRTRPVSNLPPSFGAVSKARPGPITITEDKQQDLKAWRRHYKKTFPSYVFFFENIPHLVVSNATKLITSLGASQEKFFSSKVTHVISNREAPPVPVPAKPAGRTAHPAVLQRENEPAKRKLAAATKISNDVYRDDDTRRTGRGTGDILLKAQAYGMKIWPVDKLQRVLNALMEVSVDQNTLVPEAKVGTKATAHNFNFNGPNDLQHLLRNERIHGPTDRDPHAVSKDLVYFKGPMIYVRDASGACRPIMVREYPKVSRREEGAWPQFRSVSGGKCPFIEESVHQKRDKLRERDEKANEKESMAENTERSEKTKRLLQNIPTMKEERTKAEETIKEIAKERETATRSKRPLYEVAPADTRTNSRPPATTHIPPKDHTFRVPSIVPVKRNNVHRPNHPNELAFTATNESTQQKRTQHGQEPAASGVQPSNITSAIQSQMVSSHLDQPGKRGGTSKEIYGLHRKIAGNVLLANPAAKPSGIISSQKLADFANIVKEGTKARRRETQERIVEVQQDDKDTLEREVVVEKKDKECIVVKDVVKKEPRPGYCENCREKFDDFDEHAYSRRHKRFALNDENWADLDDLLSVLHRPRKRLVV